MNDHLRNLIERKADHIRIKKAAIKHADAVVLSGSNEFASKALQTDFEDDLSLGKITRTVVANTYNWLDSHDDVHIKGLFSKSIKERQSEILHLHDHVHQLTAQVGRPLKVYEQAIQWADLGVNLKGETQALLSDTEILQDYNKMIFDQYLNGLIKQHSVGMQYVKLDLAVNDAEAKEEFKIWNDHINDIGNRDKAEEQGFFWAIKEAKLIEFSAVIRGSNELTPTIQNTPKSIEPPITGTLTPEPQEHSDHMKEFYLTLLTNQNQS